MIVAYGFISLTITPSSPPVRKPPSSFFLYSHPIAMLINPGNPCDARAKTPSTAQKRGCGLQTSPGRKKTSFSTISTISTISFFHKDIFASYATVARPGIKISFLVAQSPNLFFEDTYTRHHVRVHHG